MKKVLFIDRDGTLAIEPPIDYQLDSLEKLEFYPGVFQWLSKIANELSYELVMVTNQDGLGTDSFPEETFWKPHNKLMKALENEDIHFSEVLIDKSFPQDNAPTRKPRTGLLPKYIHGNYDLENSFVIGDRMSDMELAYNLGAKGILIGSDDLSSLEVKESISNSIILTTKSWKAIYQYLKARPRKATVVRETKETAIRITLNLDGEGTSNISTGIGFFDHMLEQISRHANVDLDVAVKGDLHIDEHHTIEDVAITLGEVFYKALGDKKAIERYGFLLPMDDCLAQVGLDFGGRAWIEWDVVFEREKVGEMPTEMFFHFFKSFSDNARCNLNIKAEGENEHHKIEAIFKGFAKAIKMAVSKTSDYHIPSTKGSL